MKKNTKYLIASLACVAVLGAAALALVLTGGSEGEDTASSASDETITLLEKTQQDLESVTVTNETGTITVLAHEETVESSSDAASSDASDASGTESESEPETEIVYEVEELEGLPFNTSDVDAIARAGYLVAANRSIGTVDDPEEFGLTDPTLTVEATFRDGSTFSYIVGVENNGAYYIQPEGSEEVYMGSVSSALFKSAYDLADTSLYQLETETDDSAAGSTAQATGTATDSAIFDTIHLSGTAFDQEVDIEYDSEIGYLMHEPRETEADTTRIGEITSALTSLSADALILPHPEEDELAQYGLDNPAVVCDFTSGGQAYTLTLSDTDADGNRYLIYSGIDAVFQIANSNVTAWADADPFLLQSTLTLLPNIVDVHTMELTMNGETYSFTIDRTVNEEDSTEDDTVYDYTVTSGDGTALDYEENFKHFYLALISITVSEDTQDMPEGEPALTCTYTYQDKPGSDTIEYYRVSDRRYAIVENGQLMGLALSDDVDLAMQDLELLYSGQDVPEVY